MFLRISARLSASAFNEGSGFAEVSVDFSEAEVDFAQSFIDEEMLPLLSGNFRAGSGADGCSLWTARGDGFAATVLVSDFSGVVRANCSES